MRPVMTEEGRQRQATAGRAEIWALSLWGCVRMPRIRAWSAETLGDLRIAWQSASTTGSCAGLFPHFDHLSL